MEIAFHPITRMSRDHDMMREVCNVLEAIADGLPDNVDKAASRRAAEYLRNDLPMHFRDEQHCLFPLLAKRAGEDANLTEVLRLLEQEHESDEIFATEVLELLDTINAGEPPKNPNMAGYMLRGFFELQRRHLAWEEAVVIPRAHACLTDEDIRTLYRCMIELRAKGGHNAQGNVVALPLRPASG